MKGPRLFKCFLWTLSHKVSSKKCNRFGKPSICRIKFTGEELLRRIGEVLVKMEASWSAQTFRVHGVTLSGAGQLPDLPSEGPTCILLTSPSACQ